MKMEFIKSPLNYVGGKTRLLQQIIPLFPKDVRLFVDLFCGGCNVGINADCNRVLFNDREESIIQLFRLWKDRPKEETLAAILSIINAFGLSDSTLHGYGFYGCESSAGLAEFNREPYSRLKEFLNEMPRTDAYFDHLFVAITFSFNNQIRFNSKGAFNVPVGKRDFNLKLRTNLDRFIDALKRRPSSFTSLDFERFDFDALTNSDFVYADPPYLITQAPYNEGGKWTAAEEGRLLGILEYLDRRNIRFALSNALESKGLKNEYLETWLKGHSNFRCHHLVCSYSNSGYLRKDRTSATDEVLITNY